MQRPRVFVTHATPNLKASLAKAEKYGDVVFLETREYMTEPAIAGHNEVVLRQLANNLVDYVPGVDFILTSGSPILILATGLNLARFKGVSHKILKWNSRDRDYELAILEAAA